MHDGAVIINNKGDLTAAQCILPVSMNSGVSSDLGTRHRAAIGLTEETDAAVLVVSEERMEISLSYRGQLIRGANEDIRKALLEVISGKDNFDSTVSNRNVDLYSQANFDKKPKKIAYIKECLESKGLDPMIKSIVEKKIHQLTNQGHIVKPISFPYLELLVPTYYVITTAEASSNLARFDGIHYGFRSEDDNDLESTYINSRTNGFGEEVKRRIMLGTFVLSSGYHDAFFTKAQKIRGLIKKEIQKVLQKNNYIISPTTPGMPFKKENPSYIVWILISYACICH